MLILLQLLLLLIGICNLSPACPPCVSPYYCIKCPTGCSQVGGCAQSECVNEKCVTITPTCSNCPTTATLKSTTTTPQKFERISFLFPVTIRIIGEDNTEEILQPYMKNDTVTIVR
ncbi:unnamed protein product [Didymodactylos carnosus]|uniref:Uncharacterized protein n=1 Tax=Didymodactylos carnosus TaxID=1234261 RepID=A0A815YFV2_9BILA|nr:unnamed protein product [Didymodactylos carnosus]CAF4433402.1 unnamed protein product [Didymodactylos carnosus]